MTGLLPRAVTLTALFNGYTRGKVPVDDAAARIRGEDPQHLVVGISPMALSVEEALPLLKGYAESAQAALPRPGHPVGLAGPPDFTMAALDAGEAVVIGPLGLIPVWDARTILWQAQPANPTAYLDPGDTSRRLRQVLLEVSARLAELEVAAWEPAIPDALLNRDHRERIELPSCYPPTALRTIEQALLCMEIAELAEQAATGALSAHVMQQRDRLVAELDVAAREALVAAINAPG